MADKKRFGIIGCGVIAYTHATSIRYLAREAELYAVCDIIPEKADEFAKRHGAEKVYYDYRQLLADPRVDIVCICVPSGLHGEVAVAAAQAGKNMVIEKPMEITPERIAGIQRAVREAGVKAQCIFQRRTMPAAIAVREAVLSGKLGRICMASAELKYYRDQVYYNSAGWRGTWELDGGGALMNQGVHGIDLIVWMLGGGIKSVYAKTRTLARKIAVEDTASLLIEMDSGCLLTIQGATIAYPGFSTGFAVYGENGTVAFNDEGVLEWKFIDEKNAPPLPQLDGNVVGGAGDPRAIGSMGHVKLLDDLIHAIDEDRPPMIPPDMADDAVKVICAAYESSRLGRAVSLD